MGKAGKHGGRGRSVSKVKLGNQKRNKLIKRGKIKPNSISSFHQQQRLKAEAKKTKQLREYDEEDQEEDGVEMMDTEDALRLNQNGGGLDIFQMEQRTLARHREEEKRAAEERLLLPIKTKKGVIVRTEKAERMGNEDDEEAGEEGNLEEFERSESSGDSDDDANHVVNGEETKKEYSVVSILAGRDRELSAFKLRLGTLASGFISAPEERIQGLEKIIQMLDHIPISIRSVGFRLASTTACELLKDVIPGYNIAHHQTEGVLLKKETKRLQKFENTVLVCAKNFLMKMERVVKDAQKSINAPHALKCLCDLLTAHPHFNYAPNIVRLVVPFLNVKSNQMSESVSDAFRQIFKGDKKGEISLTVVRAIKAYVKAKKYRCRPDLIEVLLPLRLNYVEKNNETNENSKGNKKGRKKDQVLVSRKEKKRQKQLQKVEREMREARGEEAASVRNKNFTAAAKAVFELLFRIVKEAASNMAEDGSFYRKLLPSALKCISTFCHAINVDFFDDLLRVLSLLVRRDTSVATESKEKLLCIKTAFDILTGPGEFLTYDPGEFARSLYLLLPTLDLNQPGCASSVCSVVRNMLIKRKKLVSKDFVLAFLKLLSISALQMTPDDSKQVLETILAVRSCHLSTCEALLESDETVPSKTVNFGLEVANVKTVAVWEMHLMRTHYQRDVAELADKVLSVKGMS